MNKAAMLRSLGFTDSFIRLSINEDEIINSGLPIDSLSFQPVLSIKKDNFRKVFSESNIEKLNPEVISSQKLYAKDDMAIYGESLDQNPFSTDMNGDLFDLKLNEDSDLSEERVDENQLEHFKIFSGDQISQLKKLGKLSLQLNNDIKESKTVIKAYQSKYKKRYLQSYIQNSKSLQSINRTKLYHKCNFPGCNRTLSSSGWLSSHLDEHIKDLRLKSIPPSEFTE